MATMSNQYASQVFSEHPIALWPLDDPVTFIALVDNTERNLTNWTGTRCTFTSNPLDMPDEPSPFDDDNYYEIIGDHTQITVDGTTVEAVSQDIFLFNSLNQDMKTFSLNFYLYQNSVYVDKYEIGYRYYDSYTSTYKEVLNVVPARSSRGWINFNETFEVLEFDTDPCNLIIKIYCNTGGGAGGYNFIMNGLSVGQWSETSSSKNMGSSLEALPVSTGITGYGVGADQYGPLSEKAYYVSQDSMLLAKNEGVPLVYGSDNVTKLYQSSTNLPSFIFPSKGMLNEEGKYKTYSLEFWMRVRPNTKSNRRILGPLGTNDGVYVSEGFMTLVIGKSFQSYNVSEWYRPMLVHVLVSASKASLFVNGEQVIDFSIDASTIDFSQAKNWMGFFTYSDIEIFEIDCISIMPYSIPLQVARRRFVWGQGVESQETIDAQFKGTSAAIGFPNAKYAANMIYPDKERWGSGYYNNLIATTKSLSVPEYALPLIELGGRDIQLWYDANKIVNDIAYPLGDHPKFITFRPGLNDTQTQWDRFGPDWTEKCFLQFTTANIANAPMSAAYAIFEIEENISETRPLLHFVSPTQRFEVNISGYTVTYSFNDVELYSINTSGQEHVVVGIHIPTLVRNFGYELGSFFSSYESITLYVGGAEDTLSTSYNTFEGKIYKVGFTDAINYTTISSHFNNQGFANYSDDSLFVGHYGTYTVSPFYRYNAFFLDISVAAQWEEYYPLTYFAKYISDNEGNTYYDFDFLQFNFGYPSFTEKISVEITGNRWDNYANFQNDYTVPSQKTYLYLDNENITGYQDYDDLDNNTTTEVQLDASKSSLMSYATFQLLAEGADEPLSSFPYTKEITQSYVIDADAENTVLDPYKAYYTKFKILDGTIIYPPRSINIDNVAIVIHFVVNQDGILSNPLTIRDMEITSRASNRRTPTEIGTKFGKDLYPYTKEGIYYNYSDTNPVRIYKKDTPYLYLTENSGIKVMTYGSTDKEYAAALLINETKQNNHYVGAVQAFMKYDLPEMVTVPAPVFEIQFVESTIQFVIEADSSGIRGKVSARDKWTLQEIDYIDFYQNGIKVKNPYILINEWNAIGVAFNSPLNMSSFTGAINLFGGITFNNVGVYLSEGLNEIASIIPRTWQNVLKPDGVNTTTWQYWYDNNGTLVPARKWKDVYVLAEDQYFVLTPKDMYSSYTGTNIKVIDDDGAMSITNDDFVALTGVGWSTVSGKPV